MKSQEDWENKIKNIMVADGWTFDRDDHTHIGFNYIQGKFHWIRDYCKKTRGFVQYNGNQKINIKVTSNE